MTSLPWRSPGERHRRAGPRPGKWALSCFADQAARAHRRRYGRGEPIKCSAGPVHATPAGGGEAVLSRLAAPSNVIAGRWPCDCSAGRTVRAFLPGTRVLVRNGHAPGQPRGYLDRPARPADSSSTPGPDHGPALCPCWRRRTVAGGGGDHSRSGRFPAHRRSPADRCPGFNDVQPRRLPLTWRTIAGHRVAVGDLRKGGAVQALRDPGAFRRSPGPGPGALD